ncbi:MAG TPA: hypothetical protein VG939_01795 [Caulobacteraceae bacterium]|nr:hypothetical protein [Caulobacteraceae bacterium]
MKTIIATALAAASLVGATGVSAQALQPAVATSGDAQLQLVQWRGCFAGERPYDCRERMRWEHRHHHHYVWRDGRYVDEDAGAAIAGSVLGFALGAAIAGDRGDYDYYMAHRYDRGWRRRCSAMPGFDWRSGTFIGRDGYRHYCTR